MERESLAYRCHELQSVNICCGYALYVLYILWYVNAFDPVTY